MTEAEVVIAGAGGSGLRLASLLAERSVAVTLVERLPAAGGQEPEEKMPHLVERVVAAGAKLMLGTLAVRWVEGRVETLGVDGAACFEPRALVLATGTRPATRGELGIAGDRFGGVLPGSAALHLIESGVLPGRRPMILGGGSLAADCLTALRHAGAEHVTVVAPDGILAPRLREADAVLAGWHPLAVRGNPRAEAVILERDGMVERVATDALLLAHRRVPMRNIEGAVEAGGPIIACQTTADPKSDAAAEANAERVAAQVLRTIGSTLKGSEQCK